MQDEQPLNPAEQELEAALRELRPAAAQIDRDAVLFKAGYQSAIRQMRLWQSAAGTLAASLLISLLLPAIYSSPERENVLVGTNRIRQMPTENQTGLIDNVQLESLNGGWVATIGRVFSPADSTNIATQRQDDYFRVRQAVLSRGLDVLRAPDGTGVPRRQNMQRLLDMTPDDVGGEATFKFITRNINGDQL